MGIEDQDLSVMFVFLISLLYLALTTHGEQTWWGSTSIYQVYPLSLQDSDGDGYGDLQGIVSRMGYFQELGIETIWLTPIYASPMKDFGYDVSNYLDINPIFGDIEDFKAMLAAAHDAGLRVLMDFVPNHSSSEHDWFIRSVANESPYSDYYVWVDPLYYVDDIPMPPTNWLSKVRTSAWEWVEERQQFYYHQYQSAQPDLNYRNKAVIQEMKDILDFWLDLGIDGVRMDAVSHLIEDDGLHDEPASNNPDAVDDLDWKSLEHIYTNNLEETRSILAELTEHVKNKYGDRFVVLETDLDLLENMDYYGCGDMPFNFNLARHIKGEVLPEDVMTEVQNWLANMELSAPSGSVANWVTGSHDIGRVASRVSSSLVDHLNMLVLMLPGVSVTYQGEELGMTNTNITWEETLDPAGLACGPDRYQFCSRDPERTPMQWSAELSAGFSSSETTWLPVNPNYLWLNVEAQTTDEDPHNTHIGVYKDVMKFRKEIKDLDKTVTLNHDQGLFVAFTFDFGLLLNFGEDEVSFNIMEHSGMPWDMIGEVKARSINGSTENKVGAWVDLSSVKLAGYEAVLIKTQGW